jgi:hypothetical protein
MLIKYMCETKCSFFKLLEPLLGAIYHHDSLKQSTKTVLQLTFAPVQPACLVLLRT